MINNFKATLIAAALAGALIAPLCVLAQPTSQTGYKTTLQATDPASKVAYLYGSLTLATAPDGIVRGYYKPDPDGSFIPVQGSYKDGKYWLSFGSGALQVYATKQADGTLAGSATQAVLPASGRSFSTMPVAPIASSDLYPQTFQFVATPSAG